MFDQTTSSRAAVLGLLGLAVGALLLGGCRARYHATATATTPDLVQIQPGVWVVANYADPVFYSDGLYWRYDGGVWYRSSYLGGWDRVQVSALPQPVVRVRQPRRYRRYDPPRGAQVRAVPRADLRAGVRVRRGRADRARPGVRVRERRGRDDRAQPRVRVRERPGVQVRVRPERGEVRRDGERDRGEARRERRPDRREVQGRGRGHGAQRARPGHRD